MEEQAISDSPTDPVSDLPGAGWPDWRWLALLLILVAGMRTWQICHTEVASRDSIAYIHYAWRLEHEPWLDVIRGTEQQPTEHHPGYPFSIYLVAKPVRYFLSGELTDTMQLSSQLASCIASLLLVFPMYYLGRELFDRRIAFWATLIYQCLPGPGRVMADGLSDPLFLFLATTATLLATIALRKGKPIWFVSAGAAGALAYLTRTEGALVVLMTGLVLLGLQAGKVRRRSWGAVCRDGACLAGAACLLALPFMILIGGVTLKPAGDIWHRLDMLIHGHTGMVVSPAPLAVWKFGEGIGPNDRIGWAAWAIVVELDKGFFHLLGGPALLGLFLFRRRFVEVPGARVMLGCGMMLSLLLYAVGVFHGYVGERHILLVVMGGIYFAVAALVAMAGWLARGLSSIDRSLGRGSALPGLAGPLTLMVLILMAIAPLSRTLGRLHANREGFKEAGLWLAKHSQPNEPIVDPFAWASYHAGRAFQLPSWDDSSARYVVLERSENQHPHLDFKLQEAERMLKEHPHTLVRSFPLKKGKKSGWVVVYRVQWSHG